MNEVVVVTGPGSIGQAIARRVSAGKHVVLADLHQENADRAADVMRNAGLDASTTTVDVSSRNSVLALVETATMHGAVTGVVHAAGVSPQQSPAGRAGTPDEVAAVVVLLMGPDGAFITGRDFLMDGGVTAAYFFGELAG